MSTPDTPAAVVQPDSFLTLHYRLSGPQGDVINTFGQQAATLSMGAGELSEAIELHLLGLPEGAQRTFHLPPGAAFGRRNPAMVQWLRRSVLAEMGDPAEDYIVGEVVQFPTPDARGSFAGVVAATSDEAVAFDFNHPLADQPVVFAVHILAIL